MALRRCTKPIDGTIPVQALLYNDEELLASQDGVGIYDGPQKSANHQVGTIHASSHRLFYIDAPKASSHSFSMDLSYVTQTEYYAGLFKSSPKVTLHLSVNANSLGHSTGNEQDTGFESWECDVCAYQNPPGLSPAAARICSLCGVPRTSVPPPPSSASTQHLSSSLPSSSIPSALTSSTSLATSGSRGRESSSTACPVCTFLNHPSLRACEMCGSALPATEKRLAMKSAPSSRPTSPDSDDDGVPKPRMIKVSFRKGGDKSFYAVLKRSLKSKMWESSGAGSTSKVDSSGAAAGQSTVGRSGITGILRTVETSAQGRETNMKDALQDLEALMVKAKDMVRLAADLNERLTASSTTTAATALSSSSTPSTSTTTLVPSTEPEEATFIRSSLSQLGLQMANTPVTLDMMKDERRWIEELARELARILQGSSSQGGAGMMKDRGIVALDEVWGGWNRARGVALIPPSTFLLVIPHLPAYTNPTIRSRLFPSGLSVLHTPLYTPAAFTARLLGVLTLSGPKTSMEVAAEEGITIGLADEMVAAVEMEGHICRDDGACSIVGGASFGGTEVRWWANLFTEYVWDGYVDD